MEKLVRIHITSIYGGLLPARMALLHTDVVESFYDIVRDVKKLKGKLIVSDMFRPWRAQLQAWRKKPRLAVPPGRSYHEAGLAFDFDLSQIGMPLQKFYNICSLHGWKPIFPRKDGLWIIKSKEAWHIQYDFHKIHYYTLQAAIKDVGNWKTT